MKKFAPLMALVMLAVAGAVFFQYSLDGASLRSVVTTPLHTTDKPTCEERMINGILNICCEDQFVPGKYNCSNFANRFHTLCDELGINCKTVSINCPGEGHRLNAVLVTEGALKGHLCLVEPRNIIPSGGKPDYIACIDDPARKFPPSAICKAIGVPLDNDGTCSCTAEVSNFPEIPNTDPGFCLALRSECLAKCNADAEYNPLFSREKMCNRVCLGESPCAECCALAVPKALNDSEKKEWIDSCQPMCAQWKP